MAAGVDLNEVVVTAFGVSKEKKALGYSTSSISANEVRNSQEANIIQGLAAKAPGIVVTGSGGTPGASSKILIRGAATFSGSNDPLIIIDGVPIDNTTTQSAAGNYPFNENLQGVNASNRALDINPDDIESITVLKGPAAAALYGARAGNGAIIYTTKRGKFGSGGKGIGVTFSSSVGIAEVNKLPEFQSKYGGGTGGQPVEFTDPGPDGLWGTSDDGAAGSQQSWGPKLDTTNLATYDNNDAFFETATTIENNVSLTTGNDAFAVRVSIGDLRQNGIVPTTKLDRTSFRVNADAKITDRLNMSASGNFVSSETTMAQNGSNLGGIMLGLLRTPNTFDASNYQYENGFQRTYFFVYDNPFYSANENPFTSSVNRFLGNLFASYKLTDDLSVSYRLGIDQYGDKRKQIFSVSSNQNQTGSGRGVGEVTLNGIFSTKVYGDLILNYGKDLSEKVGLDLTLGHNFQKDKFDDAFASGANLAIPNFYNLSNAATTYASNYTENINTMAIFAAADFSYDNFLFVGLTGRNDWSSTFEKDVKNNFFYPSASASLVFSELMDQTDWLSFGKLRYSWAKVGIPPVAYATRTVHEQPTYTDGFTNGLAFPFNGVNGFGLSDTRQGTDLEPETMTGNEVGVNMVFFKNLFDIDLTYYNQTSSQLLGFKPVATSSGFEDNYTNFGEMVNKGYEIALNIRPLRNDSELNWNLGVNWAKNENEVTVLAEGVDEIDVEATFGSISSFAIIGSPYGALYGSRWLRNDNGDLVISPTNGLPLKEGEDGIIGDPNPDWSMGISNSLDWKNWNLNFLFDIREGGDIWNGTYARLMQYGRPIETEDRDREYIIPGVLADADGNPTGIANTMEIDARTYFSQYHGDAGGAAEQFVEDGSWVRLRSLGIGYQFKLGANSPFTGVRVSASARNLWLSTDYRGVDPETSLTGADSNVQGYDYFNNPGTKSYRFALTFSL